jgi:hypothetical protein
MKNKMDALLREKINNLDTVPPGLTRDTEAVWEKIKKNQKAIERKTDFIKKAAWGIISAAFVASLLYFYGSEKPEEVSEVKRMSDNGARKKKSEAPLKKQSEAYAKPDPIQRKVAQSKTVAPRPVPEDTSTKIIAPITTIKPSADKQKEADTIKIPKVTKRHPTPLDNALEEDFRLDTFLKKDLLQNVQDKNKALKPRDDKKKDLFGKKRK